jgi:Putative zinc-finger
MNCRRVERLLSRHLEGRLPARAAGAVAAHLDGCPACRRRRAEFLAVGTAVRALATLPPPREVERCAIARWEAERRARRAPGASRGAMHAWAVAAAAAVLIALLGLTVARWEPPRTQKPDEGSLAVHLPEIATLAPGPRPAVNGGPARLESRLKAARGAVGGDQARPDVLGAPPVIGVPADRATEVAARTARIASLRRSALGARRSAGMGTGTSESPKALPLPEPCTERRALSTEHWASLPGEGQDSIEARVRDAVRVRDDFVQVPFPRLVSTSEQQIAQAAESYKREAAVADARLAREVTIQQKATALSDLCDRLRGETGIQLAAGSSVADEKVTIFCEKQPLRDVMRELSRPFGYTWLRSGKSGEYRYELTQDLRSQLLEEELRNRDRNAALLAVDSEMNRYRQYLGLSPDEALARARTAPPAEKKLLEQFAGSGWGVAQLYFRLTPRDLAALRAGERLSFSAEPRAGEQPLPPDLARGVLQSLRETRVVWRDGQAQVKAASAAPEGLAPASVPEARAAVSLWMAQTELGQFKLDGDSGVRFDTRRNGYAQGSPLAFGESPATRNPQNAAANARMAHDPALRVRVPLHPQPSCGVNPSPSPSPKRRGEQLPLSASGRGSGGGVNEVTTADVLEALHRASGLPIVADYYTRLYKPDPVSVRNQPLFEALNQLADAMRLRWSKGGGWLQFRSASYFNDRLKEVPNRLLARWGASRKEHGALTLDDLIEIAQLSDAQLDGEEMAAGARSCFGLAEWDLARNRSARPHLRFLAGFTPAQRQAVSSASGLPFTRMSLAQQQQFIPLALGSQADRLPSLRALDNATMRVDYMLPGGFQWKAPARPEAAFWLTLIQAPVRERSPAAALQAARRTDPKAEPSQIVPTELALTIMYPLGGPETGFRNPFVLRTDKDGNHSILARPITP